MNWSGWATQMSNMSPNSSFGISFIYVPYNISIIEPSDIHQGGYGCRIRA
jgi:hypothetical protein